MFTMILFSYRVLSNRHFF